MIIFNTIYSKIKIAVTAIGVIFLFLFFILMHFKSKQETEIINGNKEQLSHEVRSLIKMNQERTLQSLNDYAYWDDLGNNIAKYDSTWYKNNMTLVSAYFFDYCGIYNTMYGLVKEEQNTELHTDVIVNKEILASLIQSRQAHFFQYGSDGIIELNAASVHPTSDIELKNTRPQGFLVLAKIWDSGYIKKMELSTGTKIEVLPAADSITENKYNTVQFKLKLCGWEGTPVSVLSFTRLTHHNFNATRNMMFLILAFVVFTLLSALLVARKYINKPLKLVADILETDNTQSIAVLKQAPHEYGRIGSLFEKYVNQKEELRISKELAEKSDKLKSAFLANMSHEIRTPMNHIVGFSEILENENDTNKRKEYLNIIQNSSANLLKLINDLIDLSKIEANDMTIQNSEFNINEMLAELKKIYTLELLKRDKAHVQLNFYMNDIGCVIYSDQLRIKQILSNLLLNAIKFTSQGSISINCIHERGKVIFSVSDTGTGIPEEDQNMIFERFTKFDYQGLNTEGSGIGLSIVQKLVEILNGKIWLSSVLGKGSNFSFSIPVTASQTRETAINKNLTYEKATHTPTKSGKAILVVEDDKFSIILLRELLKPLNFRIIIVGNGKEAVEYIKMNPETDLVLMDFRLPVMSGLDATIEIRKFNIKIPIIAQTANAMLGDREEALNAGCTNYLAKPLIKNELYEMIKLYVSNN